MDPIEMSLDYFDTWNIFKYILFVIKYKKALGLPINGYINIIIK